MSHEDHKELSALREAYTAVFTGPHGERVAEDLARFCYADRSTFDADQRKHAFKEGRREVFLRIQEYLDLSLEELTALRIKRKRNR